MLWFPMTLVFEPGIGRSGSGGRTALDAIAKSLSAEGKPRATGEAKTIIRVTKENWRIIFNSYRITNVYS